MASFTPTRIAQNFSYYSVYQITSKEPQQLLVGKERSQLAEERQPPALLCPRAARSPSAGASNETGHKTIPKTTSLGPSTQVRFVCSSYQHCQATSWHNLDIPAAAQNTFLKMARKAVLPTGSFPDCSN